MTADRAPVYGPGGAGEDFRSKVKDDAPETVPEQTTAGADKRREISQDTSTRGDTASGATAGGRPHSQYLSNISLQADAGDGRPGKEAALISDSTTVARFSPAWRQTLAASGSILLTLSAGMTTGFSAVLLPQLQASAAASAAGAIALDPDTASWVASMAALPMAPGCLASGWLMERGGRRGAQLAVCGLVLAGWALLAAARGPGALLAGRALTGLGAGLLGPLAPVYLAEVTAPRLRGLFLAAVSLAIALGILAAHALGALASWRWTAAAAGALPALAALLLAAAPESPAWLLARARPAEAAAAFRRLRGPGAAARAELRAMLERQKAADAEPPLGWRERLRELRSPTFAKPLLIMVLFFATCQFSGVNAVAFYSVDVVERAVGGRVDRVAAVLALDALRAAASLAACALCRRVGRRPLAVASGALAAAALAGLAACAHWRAALAGRAWPPLGCLLVYVAAVSAGLVPLPWIMCGEVFGRRARGLGAGLSSAAAFLALFAVVKTAPGLMDRLGAPALFLGYGAVALLGTALLYRVLPETRGRSLQDIEDGFGAAADRSPRHDV